MHLRSGTKVREVGGEAVATNGNTFDTVRGCEVEVAPEPNLPRSRMWIGGDVTQLIATLLEQRWKRRVTGGIKGPARKLQGAMTPGAHTCQNGSDTRSREVCIGIDMIEGDRPTGELS